MTAQDTFNPELFGKLKIAEQNHFWFVVRRNLILDRIKKHLNRGASFLEIGCGTGNVSSFISAHGYRVTGCEYFTPALSLSWPGFQKVQGSAFELPFLNESFDAVGLFDVLEHFEHDDQALAEAVRITREHGVILISVPARKELWSSFDDFSSHKRRYHRADLKMLLDRAGLVTTSMEYLFMTLYLPAIVARRAEVQDPFSIGKIANSVFRNICEVERHISKVLPMPFGTSILAISHKRSPREDHR